MALVKTDNSNKAGKRIATLIFVAILFIGFAFLNLVLFYNQSSAMSAGDGRYHSDVLTYLLIAQGDDVLYDCSYPLLFLTIRFGTHFFSVEKAAALSICFYNCLSLLVLTSIFYKRFIPGKIFVAFVYALAVHFASMFFLPKNLSAFLGITRRYIGVYSPSPWHNGTYFAARPFAILAFYKFSEIIEKKIDVKHWVDFALFGLFMFLSVLAKPSFALPMLVLCGITTLFMLIKDWKATIKGVILGIIVLVPTLVDLLYQYRDSFIKNTDKTGDGIAFGAFVSWNVTGVNIPLAIIFLSFFAIVVVLVFHKFDTVMRLSWGFFAISLLMYAFLYEKGERLFHQNFSWGYMQGAFILLSTSIVFLLKPLEHEKKRAEIVKKAITFLAFSAQVICGIIYFVYLFKGGDYYTF